MNDSSRQYPWRRATDPDRHRSKLEGPIRYSVIIPAYNEVDSIRDTLDKLHGILPDDGTHELIVVNDGSSDGTSRVLHDYVAEHPDRIRLLEHASNSGYGAALKTGIRASGNELIVIADADGTYPLERIPELVDELISNHVTMVVGARIGEDVEYSRIRRIPKVFLKAYIDWIARVEVPDFNSGLRVFRRDIAEKFFGILPDGFSFTTTITLACLTNQYPVRYVPISYRHRVGHSKIQPIRDTLRFAQLIVRTGMYFAPVRILGPVAAFLMLLAMVSLGIDIAKMNLTDSTVLLFMFALNTGLLALLADMIDKRVPR